MSSFITKPKSNTERSSKHLQALREEGGKPVRVDTTKAQLDELTFLVSIKYGKNLSDVFRRAAHDIYLAKKNTNKG